MPIENWAQALRRPGFWMDYYQTSLALDEDEEARDVLATLFGDADPTFDRDALWGPDPDDAITDDMDDDQREQAMDDAADAGSVITLPFPAGYAWTIQFSSSPGIYHRLTHARGSLSLGYDDPHFHLPILRWAEVPPLVDALRRHWETLPEPPFPPEFLVPLFAPVAKPSSWPEATEATELLCQAWLATGMLGDDAARDLADRAVGAVGGWRPDPAYGWISTSRYSHRNPSAGFWSPAPFATFRRFLDAVTGQPGPEPVPAELWRVTGAGPCSPVVTVSDGTVYAVRDESLVAVDAATGEQRWVHPVDGPGFSRAAPAVHGKSVLHVGGTDTVTVRSVTGAGDPEWTVVVEEASFGPASAYAGWADATPVVSGSLAYVTGEKLYAIDVDAVPPVLVWSAYLDGFQTARGAPIVADGRVLVCAASDYRDTVPVSAFDAATGERIWSVETLTGDAGHLTVDGDDLFVAHDALTVLDVTSGKLRWSIPSGWAWEGVLGVSRDLIVGTACQLIDREAPDGTSAWQYRLVAVDRRSREIAWIYTDPARLDSSGAVVDGDTVYSVGFDDRDSTLYAVDLATGRPRWQRTFGRSRAIPTVADGTVYVTTTDGDLLAVRAPD